MKNVKLKMRSARCIWCQSSIPGDYRVIVIVVVGGDPSTLAAGSSEDDETTVLPVDASDSEVGHQSAKHSSKQLRAPHTQTAVNICAAQIHFLLPSTARPFCMLLCCLPTYTDREAWTTFMELENDRC